MRAPRRRAILSGIAAAALIASGPLTATANADPAAAPGTTVGPTREIVLITGDRVRVDAEGRMNIIRGDGREKISHTIATSGGHRYVIPSDARALIADGSLDRRLFDVSSLLDYADTGSLPLILPKDAVPDALAASGRNLDSLDATATTVAAGELPGLWSRLTSGGLKAGSHGKVWLDGRFTPLLDQSVPQVGAPTAWAAGYDGTGVTVAVLDTGYDAAHPDLSGRVKEARDFTGTAPDAADSIGHGTHVASIVAGTGAASGGKYKGVAPGANLLIGKVCVDYCEYSDMIAGMEWAAASGAAAVNMSLGGPVAQDGQEDPVVDALERITAETGTLFVVAAGNEGPDAGTVSSPGVAPSALTVGSVSKSDVLSAFSSRGPSVGNGVKPDLSAPGESITAARASIAPGQGPYLTMSGTSMATPHVTGAVAILKQEHPDWTAADIKRALTGSAKDLPGLDAFATGSGRLDVARAVAQDVRADGSVSFGRFEFPYDQGVASRKIAYTNDGDTDVTLSLALTGPDGSAANAFALNAATVTVPAHGTAAVVVSFDPLRAGAPGGHTAEVTASDTTRSLRTVAGAELGREEYRVDFPVTTVAGETVQNIQIQFLNRDTGEQGFIWDRDPAAPRYAMLAPGRYAVAVAVQTDNGTWAGAATLADYAPEVRSAMTVPIDIRNAGEVTTDVTGVDGEKLSTGMASLLIAGTGEPYSGAAAVADSWSTLRTLPGGTGVPTMWYLNQTFTSPGAVYYTSEQSANGLPGAKAVTFPVSGMARVDHTADGTLPGTGNMSLGSAQIIPGLGWSSSDGPTVDIGAPLASYHSPGVWDTTATLWNPSGLGEIAERVLTLNAGQRQAIRWFGAPFSATLDPGHSAVANNGEQMFFSINMFGGPDPSASMVTKTLEGNGLTLDVNGERVIDDIYDPTGWHGYPIPPNATGDFVLNAWTKREVPWSSRVSTSSVELHWREADVPRDWRDADVSLVRLNAAGVRDGVAPAGLQQLVSLTVEHQVAGPTSALTFEVSYDDGKTWKTVPLTRVGETALAVLKHPAGATSVSIRMTTVDSDGNTSKQTTIGSYGLK